MEAFHKRYMASNKACRLWAEMVAQMDVEMLVPQHGSHLWANRWLSGFCNGLGSLNAALI